MTNMRKISFGPIILRALLCAPTLLFPGQSVSAQELAVPDALPDFVGNQKNVQMGERADESSAKNDGTIEIKINQPYSAEALGQMVLPFMWEVSEDDEQKRIVAKEVRTHAPAVLTIDLIENIPQSVAGDDYAKSIVSALAAALEIGDATEYDVAREDKALPCEKKKNCPKIAIYRSLLSGSESGVARQCAVEIVPNAGRILVLTLCAAQSQSYRPALQQIVDDVFEGMQ